MLSFDLSHQAGVMSAVRDLVDYCNNHHMSNEEFISSLEMLIPAFKAFDHDDISYTSAIVAFLLIVEQVDNARGERQYVEYLHGLTCHQIKELRQILLNQRSAILQEIREFHSQEADNQASFISYVKEMIRDHYCVLMIRVDLGYEKAKSDQITIREFLDHIKKLRFLLKDKNGCFKHLLGYGLALEQGATKGYHAHLLLIYNGSELQQDRYIADQVIAKWKELSHGAGYGTNFNTKEKKAQYKYLGIGKIHRDNRQEVSNALKVAEYLAEPTKYIQMLLVRLNNNRTFLKGSYKPHGRNYATNFKKKTLETEAGIWGESDVEAL